MVPERCVQVLLGFVRQRNMRFFILLFLSLFFVSCSSLSLKSKSDACLLLMEREEWSVPLKRASKKWGIPEHTILAIIYHESKFIPDARPPRSGIFGRRISSAYGYSQALDGTWVEYMQKNGLRSARRTNFADSVDFIGWYLNRSVKYLGISPRSAYDLYLAYHQGNEGYRRGSYRSKPAIQRYAKKIERTAVSYKNQIRSCSSNS